VIALARAGAESMSPTAAMRGTGASRTNALDRGSLRRTRSAGRRASVAAAQVRGAAAEIREAAARYWVDAPLLAALIDHESRFSPSAVSEAAPSGSPS
jgi:hypothetical protein